MWSFHIRCSIDLHLYSDSLSTIAISASLFLLQFLPAFFSCSNYLHLSQNSLNLMPTILFSIPLGFEPLVLRGFLFERRCFDRRWYNLFCQTFIFSTFILSSWYQTWICLENPTNVFSRFGYFLNNALKFYSVNISKTQNSRLKFLITISKIQWFSVKKFRCAFL